MPSGNNWSTRCTSYSSDQPDLLGQPSVDSAPQSLPQEKPLATPAQQPEGPHESLQSHSEGHRLCRLLQDEWTPRSAGTYQQPHHPFSLAKQPTEAITYPAGAPASIPLALAHVGVLDPVRLWPADDKVQPGTVHHIQPKNIQLALPTTEQSEYTRTWSPRPYRGCCPTPSRRQLGPT